MQNKNILSKDKELYASGKTTVGWLRAFGLVKLLMSPQGYTPQQFAIMVNEQTSMTIVEKTAGIILNDIIMGIEHNPLLKGIVRRNHRAGNTKAYLYKIVVNPKLISLINNKASI